jgi:hypothetical protein
VSDSCGVVDPFKIKANFLESDVRRLMRGLAVMDGLVAADKLPVGFEAVKYRTLRQTLVDYAASTYGV